MFSTEVLRRGKFESPKCTLNDQACKNGEQLRGVATRKPKSRDTVIKSDDLKCSNSVESANLNVSMAQVSWARVPRLS